MLTQLKQSQIKSLTDTLKIKQRYTCPMCGGSLSYGRVALDHCHKTGRIREVLCNQCNRSEGKVRMGMEFMSRSGHLVKRDPIQWLRNLITYLEHHRKNPGKLVHPSFDISKGKQKPVKRTKSSTKPKIKAKRK